MLAGWHGWGAFPRVFDDRLDHTATERAAREQIERADGRFPGYPEVARRTTLNAHYTDPAIIAEVWTFLTAIGLHAEHLGWEPGAGTGLWMSHPAAPPMHGVELDPITTAIGNHLIPSRSRIDHGNLTTSRAPTDGPGVDGYDLVVGNVPFASFVPHAVDNTNDLSLHNYALVKAARLVRPGGYVTLLTSRWTLDAATPTTRDLLAAEVNLVAAIRLPTGAHAALASTEVVTDLLIMHRPHDPGDLTGWPHPVPTVVDDAELLVSSHYHQHPDRVLGAWALGGMRHRDDLRVVHPDPRGGYLGALRQRLHDVAATAPRMEPTGIAPAVHDPPPLSNERPLPVGSIVADGVGGFARLTSTGPQPHRVPASQRAELGLLCELRDATRAVLAADAVDDPDAALRRRDLNRLYDRYQARFGPLNRYALRPAVRSLDNDGEEPAPKRVQPRMGGFRSDPGWWPVAALEVFDDDTHTATKAPIMERPVARTAEYPEHVTDPAQAVRVLLARDGRITPAAVAGLADIRLERVDDWLGDTVYRDPADDSRQPAALYLSGLVRHKLTVARHGAERDPAYGRNVTALEAVQPTWLGPAEITARIGAPWIPVDDLRQFLADELHLPHAEVVHVAATATWTITAGGFSADNQFTYAVESKRTAVELVEDIANQHPTRITIEDADGRRVVDVESTAAAAAKRTELEDLFTAWVWSDPDRADRLAHVYNHLFNGYVEPVWDGSDLRFDGLAESFTPRPHQLDAVARILGDRDRGTLLAHAVGAGKTAVMAMAAMELRRLGISPGPVAVVVPNSMLQQFAREVLQLYPQGNILVADDASFSRDQRREFVARAASGAYDFVVFTHTSFTAIPPSLATIEASHRDEIDRYRTALNEVHFDADGNAGRKAVKQIETAIAALETRLTKLTERARHDDGTVCFEHLGVGHLMVDEAHLAKNLAFPTRIDGISVRESARARDLLVKVDWLRAHRGPGAVTFATATPVTNQISEAWVFARFLDPAALVRGGVDQFDAWAANFAQTITAVEVAPSGRGFRTVSRFARFTNVPELSRAFRAFADVRTAEQLDLPRPEIVGGKTTTVIVPADDDLRDFMTALVERSATVKKGRRLQKGDDTVLAVASDGRVGSLDLRLAAKTTGFGPAFGPSPKIAAAAREIATRYHDSAATAYRNDRGEPSPEPGGTQIVFCDHGVPGSPRHDVYADLADALVERGVPRPEIAFIQTAGTHEQRAHLFQAVRDGRTRVLIGSTESMGVGVNVQTRLVASHILTPPWRPDQVEQAEGRILRQGNQNPRVELLRYVREGSYDAYTWQAIERKARFISQIMTAPDQLARQVVDEDAVADEYAVLKAIATGDPRLLELAQLESRVTALERARAVHDRGLTRMRSHLDTSIAAVRTTSTALAALAPLLERFDPDAATRLHHRDGTVRSLAFGEVGNSERLGQHLIDTVRTTSPTAVEPVVVRPVVTVNAVEFTLTIGRHLIGLTPDGVAHRHLERSWEPRELRYGHPNPAGIGQSAVNLARSLPDQHTRLSEHLGEHQQRVADLSTRTTARFPHLDGLTELRQQLDTLRAELVTDNPSPTPATPTQAPAGLER